MRMGQPGTRVSLTLARAFPGDEMDRGGETRRDSKIEIVRAAALVLELWVTPLLPSFLLNSILVILSFSPSHFPPLLLLFHIFPLISDLLFNQSERWNNFLPCTLYSILRNAINFLNYSLKKLVGIDKAQSVEEYQHHLSDVEKNKVNRL